MCLSVYFSIFPWRFLSPPAHSLRYLFCLYYSYLKQWVCELFHEFLLCVCSKALLLQFWHCSFIASNYWEDRKFCSQFFIETLGKVLSGMWPKHLLPKHTCSRETSQTNEWYRQGGNLLLKDWNRLRRIEMYWMALKIMYSTDSPLGCWYRNDDNTFSIPKLAAMSEQRGRHTVLLVNFNSSSHQYINTAHEPRFSWHNKLISAWFA